MSLITLRPHHGLCVLHFVGKGYSEGFVDNMTRIVLELKHSNPMILLGEGADDICVCCPHNLSSGCESGQKPAQIDARCLSLCGFSANQVVSWAEYRDALRRNILSAGQLNRVCEGCQWLSICNEPVTAVTALIIRVEP